MKKVLSIAMCLIMIMMVFAACSKDEPSTSPGTGGSQPPVDTSTAPAGGSTYSEAWSIALLYPEDTGDFWGIVKAGGDAALAEIKAAGCSGYELAPATSGDPTLQQEQIAAALLEDVDGIVLGPANADSIGTYVTDTFTDDKGVPIVVIDRSLNTESKFKVAEVMADTYEMGQELGKLGSEALDGKGKYVGIGVDVVNDNWKNRIIGAIDWYDANAPEMKNAIPEQGNEGVFWVAQQPDNALIPFVQDVCSNNKGEDLVFMCSNEAYTNQTMSALQEIKSQRGDAKTHVVGFDFSETGYELLTQTDGMYYGAVGQNPYLMGYDSVFVLMDILEDKNVGEFVPVPYCVVTLDNLDSTKVKEYLDSMNITVG